MYCSSCGVSVAQDLSYCNHCGARLNGGKGDSLVKTTELRAESLIISGMIGLFVTGLLAISVLVGVLKTVLGLNVGQILAFLLLSFLIMLLIEGVLIWRLFHSRRSIEPTGAPARANEQATKELAAPQPRALPEGIPSVTEHTTRSFEPIYTERKAE